jgi:hypothetical protein
MKKKLDVVLGSDKDWEANLRDSHVYLVVGTTDYFEDALCFEQSWFAKKHNKPFVILLKDGVEIPKGYPMTPDPKILTWETTEDLLRLHGEIAAAINKEKP